MVKQGEMHLSEFAAELAPASAGIKPSVPAHNDTEAEIAEGACAVEFKCVGQSGQTESAAAIAVRCSAIPAHYHQHLGAPIQLDAG